MKSILFPLLLQVGDNLISLLPHKVIAGESSDPFYQSKRKVIQALPFKPVTSITATATVTATATAKASASTVPVTTVGKTVSAIDLSVCALPSTSSSSSSASSSTSSSTSATSSSTPSLSAATTTTTSLPSKASIKADKKDKKDKKIAESKGSGSVNDGSTMDVCIVLDEEVTVKDVSTDENKPRKRPINSSTSTPIKTKESAKEMKANTPTTLSTASLEKRPIAVESPHTDLTLPDMDTSKNLSLSPVRKQPYRRSNSVSSDFISPPDDSHLGVGKGFLLSSDVIAPPLTLIMSPEKNASKSSATASASASTSVSGSVSVSTSVKGCASPGTVVSVVDLTRRSPRVFKQILSPSPAKVKKIAPTTPVPIEEDNEVIEVENDKQAGKGKGKSDVATSSEENSSSSSSSQSTDKTVASTATASSSGSSGNSNKGNNSSSGSGVEGAVKTAVTKETKPPKAAKAPKGAKAVAVKTAAVKTAVTKAVVATAKEGSGNNGSGNIMSFLASKK